MKLKSCLAFLCIFAMLLPIGAFAASSPALIMEIEGDTTKEGNTFTVTVSITGNPGFSAAQYKLVYDKTVMQCDSITFGAVISGMMCAKNPDNKSTAIIAAAGTDNVTEDGELATYTFTVTADNDFALYLSSPLFGQADGKKLTVTLPSTEEEAEPEQEEKKEETEAEKKSSSKGSGGGSSAAKQEESSVEESKTEEPKAEETVTPFAIPTTPSFTDVNTDFWGYEWIEKAAAAGYIKGESEGIFAPDASMTRAAFVTMLWRRAGEPIVNYALSLDDVGEEEWYTEAVRWAVSEKIVNGTDSTHFSPDDGITRAQIAVILFRENGAQVGLEAMLASTYASYFTDSAEIADWAASAMNWAVYHEVLSGTDEKKLAPNQGASRAEVAAMLMRYCEKVTK